MTIVQLPEQSHRIASLLLCEAPESNREELAFRAFECLFRERGLPHAIRSDNDVPFASPHGYQGIPEPLYPFHDRTVVVSGRLCLGQAVGIKEAGGTNSAAS